MARKRSVLFRAVQSFLKYGLFGLTLTLLLFWGQKVHSHSLLLDTSPPTPLLVGEGQRAIPPSLVGKGVRGLGFPDSRSIALDVTERTNPTQVQQGREFYETGQFVEAVRIWQQAAKTFQTQGDILNQASTLSFLSLAYQQLGQWTEATEAIANSLKLLEARNPNKDHLPVLAQAFNIQGQLQLALGQAEQALTTWEQAAAIYTQAGDKAGITGSLINQSLALQSLGRYRQAAKALTQVEETLANQPNPMKAIALSSFGNTLRVVGDLEKSRQVLQQSLDVAQQLKSPPDISAAFLGLGNTARSQQDTEAALKFYQQAESTAPSPMTRNQAKLNQLSLLVETKQLSAAKALGSQMQAEIASFPPSRTAVYAKINFAQSLTRLKQADTANTSSWTEIGQVLANAVQQAKSIQDIRAEAYALGHLGGLYEQTQQLQNAQDLTRQALLLAQSINASDISYRWQWQLGRLLKAQGKTKDAIAAYTEAVNILQSLRSDLVTINPDVQFSFREEVEPIYRQLVELLLQTEETSKPSQDNLKLARNTIESLQLAELDNFFRTACLQGKTVQIDQVIDKDDPTAAVIYPIILADRLEVILKLPQQPLRHYKTDINQSEVERIVGDLRKQLTKPYTLKETQALSKQVYDWLILPASQDLASNIKTLVFVLDGSLRNIPMAALYDGQQYLVQKYGVALTPGLQLLGSKSLERGKIKALTAGITESRQGFAALNNVTLELNQIKSVVPTTVLLNQEFTSTAFQKEMNAVSFPVVHLATHGQFSSKAEETFILTWDNRINVTQLDNLLRIRDTNRPTAIELLVLSACQTATGDKRAALGLAGVAVRAGARSTLASLWSLDDESSALLMSQFYQELTNTKETKAEALRFAQMSLLQNPRYQHPRYWAPYVLVGNWL
ncbi:CHAT domain-containing protein [Trichocoleus sp. Lan]|uniref:CHAT domain-containing protein n=1 Tax=Trichocoleus sp. Lan TaxID=2933927 RepID=UPI003296D685